MKRVVFLTGAGMSAESGIKTFRDAGGLWEEYPVMQVASHQGWLNDPDLVNEFYNARRRQLVECQPNDGHRLVASLQSDFEVTVITQNVDNLHERAGSKRVVHLHGELMKVCSSRDVYNPHFIQTLDVANLNVRPGQKAGDGSLLRPYIVFFGEAVPMMDVAIEYVQQADVMVVIGTSLAVYPAASLLEYARSGVPIYLIDPQPAATSRQVCTIAKGASEGMKELVTLLRAVKNT